MADYTSTAAKDGARRAWIGVGLPILGLVAVTIMMAFATYWGVARDQDRVFAESSSRLVASAIDGRTQSLTSLSLDYANWQEAFNNITTRWDGDWVENNFYSSVADGMILFRADGSIRYTWFSDAFQDLGEAIAPAAIAAAIETPSLRRLPFAPTPAGTLARTSFSADGQLVIVAVTPITPEDDAERIARRGGPHDYLASVDVITDAELAAMGASLDLGALTFTTGPSETDLARAVPLPLAAADGKPLGRLEWRHAHPGNAAFQRQVWPVILGLLVTGALAILVARLLVARHISAITHAEAALESSRLKAEFLTRVSHELRTPLNAIIGYAEIIEEENAAPDTRADAQRIVTAARHLNHLLSDIFDQARIHASRMEINSEVLPVAGFLAEIHGLMRRAADEARVTLTTSSSATAAYIVADHVRLRQCLLNLVGNAIKFAPRGNVSISARIDFTDGREMVVFDVVDDGIGIANSDVDNLFRPFGQANPSISKKFGGTGLGLSISRDLARAMGGDITIVSEPGQGSTFSLSVPVATAGALRAA